MSWIDQCRSAFKQEANVLYWYDKLDEKSIITKMSNESGISKKVLRRWWKSETKNPAYSRIDLCKKCGKKPLYIADECKNPLSDKSKYYGLCGSCRYKKYKEEKKND